MQNHEKKTVGLIGAGNLGSRHLQALALLNDDYVIEVVEPNDVAWGVALDRYLEVNRLTEGIKRICSVEELSEELFVVIIATPAGPRLAIIENLLKKKKIKHLILEKVLFQSIREYNIASSLFQEYETRVWVNCARRCFDFYQNLREQTQKAKTINMIVDGGEWGLGSSSVHMVDLYGFLTGAKDYQIDSYEKFQLIESKREGYSEITGTISIISEKGNLILNAEKGRNTPLSIYIMSDVVQCLIYESRKTAFVSEESKKWNLEKKPFDLRFQSVLTNEVVNELDEKGSCSLTDYYESERYHLLLIEGFLKRINENSDQIEEVTICPIT